MTQPVEYTRQYSFLGWQNANPSRPLPAGEIENELALVKTTLDQIRHNLALIQRDDTALANGSVGYAQLNAEIMSGVKPASPWASTTTYTAGDTVFYGAKLYRAVVGHVATNFAADLAKWLLLADLLAGASGGQPGDLATIAQVTAAVSAVSTTAPFYYDDPNNVAVSGNNSFPSRYLNLGAPLMKGQNVTVVGSDNIVTAAAAIQCVTVMGTYAANFANNLYCVEGYGFRCLENMTDGQYVSVFGTDSLKTATYARSVVAQGSKSGLYKTDVRTSVLLGAATAYAPGIIENNVVIGNQAADGFSSSVTPYNFKNSIVIGSFAARGLNADYNLIIGPNAASFSTITGSFNTVFGRSSGAAITSASGNVFIGDAAGDAVTVANYCTFIGWNAGAGAVLFSNAIAIGSGETVTAADQMNLGGVIKSDRALKSTTFQGRTQLKTSTLALANGLNSNIALGEADIFRVTAPTAAFSIGGFGDAATYAGRTIRISNATGQQMTIVHLDSSTTAGARITCKGSTNVVQTGGLSSASFYSDGANWVLECYN